MNYSFSDKQYALHDAPYFEGYSTFPSTSRSIFLANQSCLLIHSSRLAEASSSNAPLMHYTPRKSFRVTHPGFYIQCFKSCQACFLKRNFKN